MSFLAMRSELCHGIGETYRRTTLCTRPRRPDAPIWKPSRNCSPRPIDANEVVALASPMKTRFLPIVVGLVALLIGAAVALWLDRQKAIQISAASLFSHTFTDVNGQPQPISQWKGKYLV